MSRAVMQFIAVVSLHFPTPPRLDDEQEAAWVASMVRNLHHYDGDVLARAASRIVDTRTRKDGAFFPLPSECKAVCDEITKTKRAEATPLLSHANRDPSPYASWRHTLAMDLLKGEMGQRAAREGYVQALYEFVHDHGRLPDGPQIAQIRSVAADLVSAVAECRQGRAGLLSRSLADLGQSILARRQKISAEVLEG